MNNLLLQISQGRYDEEEDPGLILEMPRQVPHIKVAVLRFKQRGIGGKITPLQSKEEIAAMLKDFAFQPKKVSQSE